MIARTTIAAAVISLAAFTAAPANAGISFEFGFDGPSYSHYYGKLSPWEVRRILRHRGYHDIDFVDRHGRIYKLTATRHGDDYFIVVDAYSGEIIHRHEV